MSLAYDKRYNVSVLRKTRVTVAMHYMDQVPHTEAGCHFAGWRYSSLYGIDRTDSRCLSRIPLWNFDDFDSDMNLSAVRFALKMNAVRSSVH